MPDSITETQVGHEISGGRETYTFKLKDKTNRRAVEIKNPDLKPMKIQSILLEKVPNSNNKVMLTLIKVP